MRITYRILLLSAILLCSGIASFCQETAKKDTEAVKKKPSSMRFHSGTILAAELLPEGFYPNPTVLNPSRFEPASRITTDVAFATVTVKLDSGRSLSIYDYSLLNRRKDEYKCMGISEGDTRYDAEKWEFPTINPDKLYTMLFKVQLPSSNEKNEYVLHFNLNKAKSEDITVPFVRITRNFTPLGKIPAEGIIGIDPEPPAPLEPAKPAGPTKPAEPAKPTEPAKPAEPAKKPEPAAPKKVEPPAKDMLLEKVPDAKKYTLIYELDLKKSGDTVKYTLDDRGKYAKKEFVKIAYFVELKTETGELQYVFVSMNPFTKDLSKIGVPTVESKINFQQFVEEMTVISNVKGVTNCKDIKGNIEFWPHNYTEKNAKKIPNAYDNEFDAGDEIKDPENGYGSMQVHNFNDRETIFAYNHWSAGKDADLGIGNSPTAKSPDWTMAKNASTFTTKRLRILVIFK